MRWLTVSGVLSLALYATALTIPDWGREFTRFGAVYAGLLAAYGLAIAAVWRARRPLPPASGLPGEARLLAAIWLGAVLFRLVVLAAPPTLSDDIFRYLWDGRVLAHGINPYRFAPGAPELAPLRDALWASVTHPSLPTIYPPLLVLVFAGATLVSHTVLAWKAATALADLAAGAFLMRALARRGRPRAWIVLYLWHPLVVVEFAGNGHADAMGLLLVSAALAAWAARRWTASGVAIALAGLVKFLPWVALPALLPRLRARWLLLPALVLAFYLPFLHGGVNALGNLGVYLAKWRANDFLFAGMLEAREALLALFGRAAGPPEAALRATKLAAAAIVAAAWLAAIVRTRSLPAVYSWTVGAALLLSPVVHPWYVLWLLPAAVYLAQPAWWIWTVTAALAYLPLPVFRAGGPWIESTAVKALEYLPVLVALAWTAWRARASRGTSAPERRGRSGEPRGEPCDIPGRRPVKDVRTPPSAMLEP